MNTTGYYDPISAVRPILPGGSEAWRFELNHFQGGPAVCDFNKMMLAWADACFDDMTREPCDDRDDGFNMSLSKGQTRPVRVDFHPMLGCYVCIPYPGGVDHSVAQVHHLPDFLGIVYKIGDTTTFGPGPYDESLGVPVTVHFRKG